ncbi:MAG: MotA/TolQ/ExbB proton channel family protein [Pseudomonadota bacterium]
MPAGAFSLLTAGGPLVPVIVILTAVLWMLIIERYLFQTRDFALVTGLAVDRWAQREDRSATSWAACAVRRAYMSSLGRQLDERMGSLKGLLFVLPLLGLLGTVTGMIDLFDLVAAEGQPPHTLMAAHLAALVLPTLAGLTGAVSGVFFVSHLERRRKRLRQALPGQFLLTDDSVEARR